MHNTKIFNSLLKLFFFSSIIVNNNILLKICFENVVNMIFLYVILCLLLSMHPPPQDDCLLSFVLFFGANVDQNHNYLVLNLLLSLANSGPMDESWVAWLYNISNSSHTNFSSQRDTFTYPLIHKLKTIWIV